jgi:hypothetical protein
MKRLATALVATGALLALSGCVDPYYGNSYYGGSYYGSPYGGSGYGYYRYGRPYNNYGYGGYDRPIVPIAAVITTAATPAATNRP